MATNERFDESVSKWLEESAPARLPERVLTATFERTRRSRQHVGWRTLLGRPDMNRFAAALGSAAVLVVAAALALSFYANRPGIGGRPTPTPTSSTASPPLPSPTLLSNMSPDGEVSVSLPSSWQAWMNGRPSQGEARDVWYGMIWRRTDALIEPYSSGIVGLVDPVAYDLWCKAKGGSPLLTGPADAAAIAQQLRADPNFETTAPVHARIGGLDALSMDVTLAPGGRTCGVYIIVISRWIHGLQPGMHLRLYLVDLPKSMSVDTLAITVMASDDHFAEVLAETAPIVESIEFYPGAGATSPSEVP